MSRRDLLVQVLQVLYPEKINCGQKVESGKNTVGHVTCKTWGDKKMALKEGPNPAERTVMSPPHPPLGDADPRITALRDGCSCVFFHVVTSSIYR